ncbi:hypothetical protein C5167_048867 [Papaver somniferum]|uniref:Protein kinase domain-containing protein n=1 Tax=Papaver somniferum TaxID=3469 RepID=A0A4Y7KMQ6_PAPSO|nr:hypothetical protein C5167_048867 [Papaver somniferum]
MGCICSKGSQDGIQYVQSRSEKEFRSSKLLVAPSKRDQIIVETDCSSNGTTVRLLSKPTSQEIIAVSTPPLLSSDDGVGVVVEKKKPLVSDRKIVTNHQRRATTENGVVTLGVPPISRIISMPRSMEAEQAAAGWPSWLTAVAGEAIKGWVPRRADSFEKLDKIGQGTYSSVYRARDLETGKICALKKVRFVNNDPESVRFMVREIHILRRLDHPNVIKLEGLVTSRMSCSLYLVFEYMEHDLAGLAASPDIKFTEAQGVYVLPLQIKCYMQQLLLGLEHCHTRGVLHRDIKGSNLLIDNNGILRIADFGLATLFRPDQKQPLTSRVVTLWYRPPELLLGATQYGVGVDLWSAGCILAELLVGKPIMPGRTEVEQLHKIFKLCGSPSEDYWRKSRLPHTTIFKPSHPYRRCVAETFKDIPSSSLGLLEVLLAIEPERRGSAASSLKSEFFTAKPLPCDPSTLPKYPPSKEFDAKLRDEEARRQRAAAMKGHGAESRRRGLRDAKPAPQDSNAESQKRHGPSNSKSTSQKFNVQEDGGSGFPIEPRGGSGQNSFSRSGPLMHPGFGSARSTAVKEYEAQVVGPTRPFGSSRNGAELRTQRSHVAQGSTWSEHKLNGKYNQLDDVEASEKQKWEDGPASSQKKGDRVYDKESTTGYVPKKNRIHYSGPLMPPGGNMDEMLREHERQIQQAVRRARIDKAKIKSYGENGQAEALLYSGRQVR